MKARAAAFLDRFRRADRDDALLHAMADDYDGLAAAMMVAPDELLAAANAAGMASGPPVDLSANSFASAVSDRSGNIIVADERFRDWLGGPQPLEAVVRAVAGDRASVSAIAHDRSGRPVAVAAARLAMARGWPLAPAVRDTLDAGRGDFAVIAFRPDGSAWDLAARAYGLSRQQQRLAMALARCGDLQAAAADLGIAYETARKLIAAAMRKTGAARQTDLVRQILSAAAGDMRPPEGAARLFAELFGLSLRQAELAQAIARGATREAAAAGLKISVHGAKTDMKVVFQACGIANAVDLARIVAEVDALTGLATACSVEIARAGAPAEPLLLVARRHGAGRIAVADHGPARGRPLLMFHAAIGGRHQPRRLVKALQAAGWRPIAFDRPGFGLTDMADAAAPFAATAADVVDILDALGIARVTLFGRTASLATLVTAAELGGRVDGGILVGPELPADLDRRQSGMMGRGKALFFGNAALATAFARILSRRTSTAQIARMQRQSVAGSAIDESALDDPQTLDDIVRASRQAALGMQGFLAEMQMQGAGTRPPVPEDTTRWTVLVGAADPLYVAGDVIDFWTRTLPGAQVDRIADGGRWLHLTHVAAIVAALARLR